MACGPFFSCAGAVRVDLDDRTVQADRLQPHPDQLFDLHALEDPIQDPGLGPPVHPHVDRVPVAEPLGQGPPLAAIFGHEQDRVEHLKVVQRHIAPLPRQVILDTRELRRRKFHAQYVST